MARAIPTLGYPSRSACVADLHRLGMSYTNIAARLGITAATASALHISYRRRNQAGRIKQHCSVTIPCQLLGRMQTHASQRNISAGHLARLIIEAVVSDNIVDAVLDDKESTP